MGINDHRLFQTIESLREELPVPTSLAEKIITQIIEKVVADSGNYSSTLLQIIQELTATDLTLELRDSAIIEEPGFPVKKNCYYLHIANSMNNFQFLK